jgi:hypothetical protein
MKTLTRTFQIPKVAESIKSLSSSSFPLRAKLRTGTDGSGSQPNSHQKSSNDLTQTHKETFVICLDSVTAADGEVVYDNEFKASDCGMRPLGIVPAKENDELVGQIMSHLDPETEFCNSTRFDIIGANGDAESVPVYCDIKISLVDGKIVSLLMGCGGAYCKICTASDKDAHDVTNVVNGFSLDRSVAKHQVLFDKLFDPVTEKIRKKTGDYSVRLGLTKQPLTSQESVCTVARPLHLRLCDLHWFLQFLYRIIAHVLIWQNGKLTAEDHIAIDGAKKTFISHIKTRTGILIDSPCNGGTTNTGNVAWRFFSPEVHDAIIEIVPEEWKERVSFAHQNLSVILRVLSTTQKVNFQRLHELSSETYVYLLEKCEFAHISESLHGTLGHGWQLIELNDGYGLGTLTEQGSEG